MNKIKLNFTMGKLKMDKNFLKKVKNLLLNVLVIEKKTE